MKFNKKVKKYAVVDDSLLGFIKGTILKLLEFIILSVCFVLSFIYRSIIITLKIMFKYTNRLCRTNEGKLSLICLILLIFGVTFIKIENSQMEKLLEKYAITIEEQSRVIGKQRDLINRSTHLVANKQE